MGGSSPTRTPGRRWRRNRISQVLNTGSNSSVRPAACTRKDEWPINVTPNSSAGTITGSCAVPASGVTADRHSRRPM
jgi:hypothetical protein